MIRLAVERDFSGILGLAAEVEDQFGPDHPGAESREFYERLGYTAGPMTEPGPEGGSRQIFRTAV